MFVSDIGPSTDDVVFLEPANNQYNTTDEVRWRYTRSCRGSVRPKGESGQRQIKG